MDLETAIADHEQRGYRLDMIMPADNPRIAVVSKGNEMLRLTATAAGIQTEPFTGLGHPIIPQSTQEFVIGCPAEHETLRDHDLTLPTPKLDPSRNFGGQRFVRHTNATSLWQSRDGVTYKDTGIAIATNNLAGVRTIKIEDTLERTHDGDFLFFYVLQGSVRLAIDTSGTHTLAADDCCALPKNSCLAVHCAGSCTLLEVTVT